MSLLFEKFELHELVEIIETKNFREMATKLGHKRFNELIKIIKPTKKSNIINNNIIQSATVALEAASYPLLTLWTVTNLINVTASMLAFITSGVFALMLITGIVYFSSTYSELKKIEKRNELLLQFATFKLILLDEIIKTLKNEIIFENIDERIFETPKIKRSETTMPKIRDSIGISLMTSATLFGTYYLGTHAIITAFQLSTLALAMSGPIGIGIACACALLVGLYFGYKHYQVYKNAENMRKTNKELNKKIQSRYEECAELMKEDKLNLTKTKKSIPHIPSIMKPRFRLKNKYHYTFHSNASILMNKKRYRLGTGQFIGNNLYPKNQASLYKFNC